MASFTPATDNKVIKEIALFTKELVNQKKIASRQTTTLIRLTWLIAVLTVIMTAAVILQIYMVASQNIA